MGIIFLLCLFAGTARAASEPFIRIDPVYDHFAGDKFTVTAQTNLAAGDDVLVRIYSSSINLTQKNQSGEFSGASGTVAVMQGTNGINTIAFSVDTSAFKPDEYNVTMTAVIQNASDSRQFNILTGTIPPRKSVATIPPFQATTPLNGNPSLAITGTIPPPPMTIPPTKGIGINSSTTFLLSFLAMCIALILDHR